MTSALASIDPFYAACLLLCASPTSEQPVRAARSVVIGDATLCLGDCFDILPSLAGIDAVVTDPPFGIGFAYRSHVDSRQHYADFMARLVPHLNRVTDGGPCFVWQSPLKADQWHKWFPKGFRIIAGCKAYPDHRFKTRPYSWDPIIFWSQRGNLRDEHIHRDWVVSDLSDHDDCPERNPHPCPRPLAQVTYICRSIRASTICDPFMGSGTTAVACIRAGKRFVGIEKDPEYFAFACDRIERAYSSTTTKGVC